MLRGAARSSTMPVIRWIEYRLPIFSFADGFMGSGYPAPRNLSYWWNFGSLAGIALVLQIMTGVVLAMTYVAARRPWRSTASSASCATSTSAGCCATRTANGASMFFIVVYIHLFRGLYYGSYKAPRELLVDARRGDPAADDGHRVHGLRPALGPDELLGGDRDHQPVLGDPDLRRDHRHPGCGAASRSTTRRSAASTRCTICCRS